MKKFTLVLLMLLSVLVLAGCSKITESYANKVDEAAAADEHLTYAQVIKDLGEAHSDATVDVPVIGRNGLCIWYAGCDSETDARAKVTNGETVYVLTITFAGGKAIDAAWNSYKPS